MTTPTSNTCPCTIVPDMVMSTIYHACPVHGIGPIPRNPENCTCTPSSLNVACPIHGPSICWRAERTPEPQTEPIPTPDLVSKGDRDVYQTEQSLDEELEKILEGVEVLYDQGYGLANLKEDTEAGGTAVKTLLALIASEREKAREEFANRLLEQQTYAQWALEREEPTNMDKAVVLVSVIEAELKPTNNAPEGQKESM